MMPRPVHRSGKCYSAKAATSGTKRCLGGLGSGRISASSLSSSSKRMRCGGLAWFALCVWCARLAWCVGCLWSVVCTVCVVTCGQCGLHDIFVDDPDVASVAGGYQLDE